MAKKPKKISVHLSDQEQIRGIVYLLASFFLLPELLRLMNGYLPTQLSNVWINFLYFLINFVFIVWFFWGFFQRNLIYAGKHIQDFLIGALVGSGAYWLCNWAFCWMLGRFFPDYANLNDGSISQMVQENFPVMFLGTVIFVPVAEEALHRGLIFGCLYPKNPAAAYLLSTVIFACVHIAGYVGLYSPVNLLLAFGQYVPAGLILAWAYRKSGSIFAPILIHAVINAVGMLAQR